MFKIISAIVLGGVVAGALDITYACIHWHLAHGVMPMRIFQAVAAGLFGREAAVAGGWQTASVGLAMHFLLTTIMAAFFVAWTTMVPDLNKWPLLSGVTYGLGLFVIMQFVVLPLSALHTPFWPPRIDAPAIAAHCFLFGFPIALAARRILIGPPQRAAADA